MAERPEDLNLPNAVITRIIKDALPDNVNVSKEARLAISKAASVFVLYATSCANNFALKGRRKTINANDVMEAMGDMEFESFVEPLQKCLENYRKSLQEKKVKKATSKEDQTTSASQSGDNKNDEKTDDVIEIDDSGESDDVRSNNENGDIDDDEEEEEDVADEDDDNYDGDGVDEEEDQT